MSELANRTVALDDVLGAAADELVERIDDTEGWPARFALVEGAIAARLADAPPLRREVGGALGQVAAGPGRRVGDVAPELGWSHRRLIARFRDDVGLPPKRVARIARFERLRADRRRPRRRPGRRRRRLRLRRPGAPVAGGARPGGDDPEPPARVAGRRASIPSKTGADRG